MNHVPVSELNSGCTCVDTGFSPNPAETQGSSQTQVPQAPEVCLEAPLPPPSLYPPAPSSKKLQRKYKNWGHAALAGGDPRRTLNHIPVCLSLHGLIALAGPGLHFSESGSFLKASAVEPRTPHRVPPTPPRFAPHPFPSLSFVLSTNTNLISWWQDRRSEVSTPVKRFWEQCSTSSKQKKTQTRQYGGHARDHISEPFRRIISTSA
ncbi:hypothetical protein H920_20534 [Fukomys damarensis]|uniref:Uncharacterized protein n=1 Tax=Fukomys damarensis TaxID=885580 RepID=A0A091CK87_FUKDA|nr:hypothetical protein H920_20534 [Fukomys damarensis]